MFTTKLFTLSFLFASAQESYRPGLFFREDWKETPADDPFYVWSG